LPQSCFCSQLPSGPSSNIALPIVIKWLKCIQLCNQLTTISIKTEQNWESLSLLIHHKLLLHAQSVQINSTSSNGKVPSKDIKPEEFTMLVQPQQLCLLHQSAFIHLSPLITGEVRLNSAQLDKLQCTRPELRLLKPHVELSTPFAVSVNVCKEEPPQLKRHLQIVQSPALMLSKVLHLLLLKLPPST